MKQKKCKWCGKPFTPTHNRQEYGVDGEHQFLIKRNGKIETTNCKKESRRWTKAQHSKKRQHQPHTNKYQQQLYYPNNNVLGTTNPSTKKRKPNFYEEYQSIQKEFRKLGLTPSH